MEYTVKKLAALAGVSPRTLRFYDEIGLLKPQRINSSGYRIYTTAQADKLQQILYYRELGMDLEEIKTLMYSNSYNPAHALHDHLIKLKEKRSQIDRLIESVEKSITYYKGGLPMSDNEKFQAFKTGQVTENALKYGNEIKEKYGEKAFQESNQRFMNLTQEAYKQMNDINDKLMALLSSILTEGDHNGQKALEAARLHKQWLSFTWKDYSQEAHENLVELYVADDRFSAYYDEAAGAGAAEALRSAVLEHIDHI